MSNDSSNINFKAFNSTEYEFNILKYIEDNFIPLSKINKKYLQELIKEDK